MTESTPIDPQVAERLAHPPELGDAPEDRRDPATTDELAHLIRALRTPVAQVADLYAMRQPQWNSAPDPRPWLADMHAADAHSATLDGTDLRVLTYNLALLDARIFWGLLPYSHSPLLEERRTVLPDMIFGVGADILLLQELWRDADVTLFTAAAARHGYRSFVTSRSSYNDGLATFIKLSLFQEGAPVQSFAKAFAAQDWTEYFPGPGIRRGYQWTRFHHQDIGRVDLFNTHTLAFPKNWRVRMLQARELGLAARTTSPESALTLVGGDLNSAPFYPSDEWAPPGARASSGWYANAMSYALLAYYGGVRDLAVAGRPAEDALADVTAMLDGKLSPDGWPFTANSATNDLYRQQYGTGEYPARLDHVLGRGDQTDIRVRSTHVLFGAPVTVARDLRTPASDHFGVTVELVVAPRSTAP